MKQFSYAIGFVIMLLSSLQAQNYSECQAPDAHMNPKCSGSSKPAPAAKTTVSVGGTYALTGTSPQGKKYQGSVTITGDAQKGYQFNWSVGPDQYSGTGTLAGDTITVDWGAPEPAVFKVLDGGARLNGKWGKKGRGREILTRDGK